MCGWLQRFWTHSMWRLCIHYIYIYIVWSVPGTFWKRLLSRLNVVLQRRVAKWTVKSTKTRGLATHVSAVVVARFIIRRLCECLRILIATLCASSPLPRLFFFVVEKIWYPNAVARLRRRRRRHHRSGNTVDRRRLGCEKKRVQVQKKKNPETKPITNGDHAYPVD